MIIRKFKELENSEEWRWTDVPWNSLMNLWILLCSGRLGAGIYRVRRGGLAFYLYYLDYGVVRHSALVPESSPTLEEDSSLALEMNIYSPRLLFTTAYTY